MDIIARHLAGFPWQHRYQFEDVVAVRFIRKLKGLSQAVLVLGENQRHYVIKLDNAYGGDLCSPDEYLGYSIQCGLGLPGPKYGRVYLSMSMIERSPMLWFDSLSGPYRPPAGFHFATEYLGIDFVPPARFMPVQFKDYISDADVPLIRNKTDFLGILLLDLFTGKTQNRKALLRGRALYKAYFIDHGVGSTAANDLKKLDPPLNLQQHIYKGLWNPQRISHFTTLLKYVVPKVLAMAVPFPYQIYNPRKPVLRKAEALDRIEQLPKLLQPYEDILRYGPRDCDG